MYDIRHLTLVFDTPLEGDKVLLGKVVVVVDDDEVDAAIVAFFVVTAVVLEGLVYLILSILQLVPSLPHFCLHNFALQVILHLLPSPHFCSHTSTSFVQVILQELP